MTMDEIKALIDAMGTSDLAEMEVAKDGWTLRLLRHAPPREASAPQTSPAPTAPAARPAPRPRATPAASGGAVRAPLAGTVHLRPAPEAEPFVAVGQSVEVGAVLCTVEAMKTFNEVRAERAGTIAAVLVASGDEVEGGQPLMRID